jgi:hypothetical protein
LVGGEPLQANEHAVILALSGLAPRVLYRLACATGLAKIVLAGDPDLVLGSRPVWRARGAWFEEWLLQHLGPAEKQQRSWARLDLQNEPGREGTSVRRRLTTLGLISIARLLTGQEPHRVRWTLQHLPYPIAKRIRSIMARSSQASTKRVEVDSMLLRAAWERLALDRHVTMRYPEDMLRGEDVWDVD